MDVNVKSVPGREEKSSAIVGCFLGGEGLRQAFKANRAKTPGLGLRGFQRSWGSKVLSMTNSSRIHHLGLIAGAHRLHLYCAFIEATPFSMHLCVVLLKRKCVLCVMPKG